MLRKIDVSDEQKQRFAQFVKECLRRTNRSQLQAATLSHAEAEKISTKNEPVHGVSQTMLNRIVRAGEDYQYPSDGSLPGLALALSSSEFPVTVDMLRNVRDGLGVDGTVPKLIKITITLSHQEHEWAVAHAAQMGRTLDSYVSGLIREVGLGINTGYDAGRIAAHREQYPPVQPAPPPAKAKKKKGK